MVDLNLASSPIRGTAYPVRGRGGTMPMLPSLHREAKDNVQMVLLFLLGSLFPALLDLQQRFFG